MAGLGNQVWPLVSHPPSEAERSLGRTALISCSAPSCTSSIHDGLVLAGPLDGIHLTLKASTEAEAVTLNKVVHELEDVEGLLAAGLLRFTALCPRSPESSARAAGP